MKGKIQLAVWTSVFAFSVSILGFNFGSKTTYRKRPGLIWVDCGKSDATSLSECSALCYNTDRCLGFNFDEDPSSPEPCQLYQHGVTKSLKFNSISDTNSMYFSFNTERKVTVESDGKGKFSQEFSDGLVDGQMFVIYAPALNDKHGTGVSLMIVLAKDHTFTDLATHSDMTVIINPDTSSPMANTITIMRYDVDESRWVTDNQIQANTWEYITVGRQTEFIVLVSQSAYTLYINGKLFGVYKRSQKLTLAQVKTFFLMNGFESVYFKL